MRLNKALTICSIVAILLISVAVWKYSAAISERNTIEKAKIELQTREEAAEQRRKQNFTECLASAQGEYDARAAQGPIFGDGPRLLMESKKDDCERIYGK